MYAITCNSTLVPSLVSSWTCLALQDQLETEVSACSENPGTLFIYISNFLLKYMQCFLGDGSMTQDTYMPNVVEVCLHKRVYDDYAHTANS